MRTRLSFVAVAALLVSGAFLLSSFRGDGSQTSPPSATNDLDGIAWMTWDEAMTAHKSVPKSILIDVYTDWCGWCKRMDANTFQDPGVVEYVNGNFYAVKLNAEQREDIEYDGHTFSYVRSNGRGYHELAQSLLDGRLEYPNFVYFNERMERVMISPGYKEPDAIMKELKYVMGEGERP